jgi:hypothetical protein
MMDNMSKKLLNKILEQAKVSTITICPYCLYELDHCVFKNLSFGWVCWNCSMSWKLDDERLKDYER